MLGLDPSVEVSWGDRKLPANWKWAIPRGLMCLIGFAVLMFGMALMMFLVPLLLVLIPITYPFHLLLRALGRQGFVREGEGLVYKIDGEAFKKRSTK